MLICSVCVALTLAFRRVCSHALCVYGCMVLCVTLYVVYVCVFLFNAFLHVWFNACMRLRASVFMRLCPFGISCLHPMSLWLYAFVVVCSVCVYAFGRL